MSFLHRHSDHNKVDATTLNSVLNLWGIPYSQRQYMLATLRGGYKFDATWMTDHVARAKVHWKNKCLIVSSWWKNYTSYFHASCGGRGYPLWGPRRRYHIIFLTLSGILDFQILLLLSTGISECVSAGYIESTEKRHSVWDSSWIHPVLVSVGSNPGVPKGFAMTQSGDRPNPA